MIRSTCVQIYYKEITETNHSKDIIVDDRCVFRCSVLLGLVVINVDLNRRTTNLRLALLLVSVTWYSPAADPAED